MAPLEVFDVLLGQPYMWNRHVVYLYRPLIVIITLGNKLYRILDELLATAVRVMGKGKRYMGGGVSMSK